jgi:predicted phosphodiesterase
VSSYAEGKEPICPVCQREKIRTRGGKKCKRCADRPGWFAEDLDHPLMPRSYESQWLQWQQFIGQAKERYAGPSKRPVTIGRQKIVIASDFHAPFHAKACVAAMFEAERDADLLIVNGDLQDFYSISRFTKYENVTFEEEMAAVTLLLEQMSERFPRVLIVSGNHDQQRFEKQLRERLSEEMCKVVAYLAGGNLSAIAAACKRYPNIELARHQVDASHSVGWFAQVNDLIVTHAEKFSITPGAALRKINEWFVDQADTLKLKPWRVLAQAHTHQLGMFPFEANKFLIETGCLCNTHGYQLVAKIGGRPQRRGYITLVQNDGVTDINSIRMRWFDVESKVA